MRLKEINYNSIEAIQAAGPYAVIHFRNGKTFVASRSLKYLQGVWPQLVRISRTHAINPDQVLFKGENEVVMKSKRSYAVKRPWRRL